MFLVQRTVKHICTYLYLSMYMHKLTEHKSVHTYLYFSTLFRNKNWFDKKTPKTEFGLSPCITHLPNNNLIIQNEQAKRRNTLCESKVTAVFNKICRKFIFKIAVNQKLTFDFGVGLF